MMKNTPPALWGATSEGNPHQCAGGRVPYDEAEVDRRHGQGYFQYIDSIVQKVLFTLPMPSEEERALLHSLIHAKIRTESEYNPLVTSSSGFKGLGQLGRCGSGGAQAMIHLHYLNSCMIENMTTASMANYDDRGCANQNFFSEDTQIFAPECSAGVRSTGSHLSQSPQCLEKIKSVCTTSDGKFVNNIYCPEFNILLTAGYLRYLLLSNTSLPGHSISQRGTSLVDRHRWASGAYNAGPVASQSSWAKETRCHQWRIAGSGGGFGASSSDGDTYLGFYAQHLCDRATQRHQQTLSAPEGGVQ